MANNDQIIETRTVKGLNDLAVFASDFLNRIFDIRITHSTNGAMIVTLRGDLGAGKTAFVKECAKIMGVHEDITSPTFVIMKKYDLKEPYGATENNFTKLIHIDAYRLADAKDLQAIGWPALVGDSHNLIMIEWPERIESPDGNIPLIFGDSSDTLNPVIHIDIEHRDDGSRVYTVRV